MKEQFVDINFKDDSVRVARFRGSSMTTLSTLLSHLEAAENAARDVRERLDYGQLRLAVDGARSWCAQSRYRIEFLMAEEEKRRGEMGSLFARDT